MLTQIAISDVHVIRAKIVSIHYNRNKFLLFLIYTGDFKSSTMSFGQLRIQGSALMTNGLSKNNPVASSESIPNPLTVDSSNRRFS